MKPNQLTIYNSLSRNKELFRPIHEGRVGMYVCGPTVYGDGHLGHARPAITFDILYRYLTHLGYKVRYVRNITDVGHLEHDADDGEDKIAKKAGVKYRVAKGGSTGKALYVLGFAEAAKLAAEAFAEAVNKTGVKTVVVSSPAAYDALVNDFKAWGVKLDAKVMHVSEFIVSLKLKFSKKAGKLCYLESDFLKNYNGNLKFPRALLAQVKAESGEGFTTDLTNEKTPFMFGTNNEESYTCGEGAVVFAQLRPEIVKKMAKYVEARADKDVLLAVASPYTKTQLSKKTKLKVSTLTEIAAECL